MKCIINFYASPCFTDDQPAKKKAKKQKNMLNHKIPHPHHHLHHLLIIVTERMKVMQQLMTIILEYVVSQTIGKPANQSADMVVLSMGSDLMVMGA